LFRPAFFAEVRKKKEKSGEPVVACTGNQPDAHRVVPSHQPECAEAEIGGASSSRTDIPTG
jgi:hypothetical protein